MDTNQIFLSTGLKVEPTELNKWIVIRDMSPEFYTAFKTNRLGKIEGDHFYVTLRAIGTQARGLMTEYGFEIVELGTTNGKDDATYPGFSLDQCTLDTLTGFVERLRAAVALPITRQRRQAQ